ncbi:MAG TPA: LysM peptidoglycan-binding domain-containing protein [Candidatus Limnocylindrales bacterium]
MTVRAGSPVTGSEPSPGDGPSTLPAGSRVCPYLLAAGGWRSIEATREQRCTATEPPTALALEKQRRLCLAGEFEGCATYQAAVDDRERRLGSFRHPLRPIARTAPLVLDRARPRLRLPDSVDQRRAGQLGLIGLMVVALGAVVVSRLPPGAPGSALGPTPSPTVAVASLASPKASASPVATVGPATSSPSMPTPVPTTSPSQAAETSPSPSIVATTTYRVKKGDTLVAIAARFGTTVRVIQDLNAIANPSLIRIGQVLKLP